MLPETGDILHLAESLTGVADLGDAKVAMLLAGLGHRLGNLQRCQGRAAVLSAVAAIRPDYVVIGGAIGQPEVADLKAAMRTASLGVMILRPEWPSEGLAPQIEVDPFDPALGLNGFALHLRAMMRRCRPVALSGRQSHGGITLDEAALTLATGTATSPLSLEDFRLIGPLFDGPGLVWPREALLRLAYGGRTANGLRTVDVKLNRTRRRLRAALGQDPIRSVRGAGYILDPAAG